MKSSPIGMFDSGLGGLSVLKEIRRFSPAEDIIYFADQANSPYGPRTLAEVRSFSIEISRFLIAMGAKIIVVACNTASAAALHHLRQLFPSTPFVGMEPAVKPAAESSQSKHIGVLATEATFKGKLFSSVVERFAQGVDVYEQTLPGLVERIEARDLTSPETRNILQTPIEYLRAEGVDTLVLGCTHFPLVLPLISELAGPGINIIDPAPAIARRINSVLKRKNLLAQNEHQGQISYLSSINAAELKLNAEELVQLSGTAISVIWNKGQLVLR
jgi:glutamate racemase